MNSNTDNTINVSSGDIDKDIWVLNMKIGSKILINNAPGMFIFYGYNHNRTLVSCYPQSANNIVDNLIFVNIDNVVGIIDSEGDFNSNDDLNNSDFYENDIEGEENDIESDNNDNDYENEDEEDEDEDDNTENNDENEGENLRSSDSSCIIL